MQVVRREIYVVQSYVVLALVICHVFLSGVPAYIMYLLFHLITNPKNLISIARDHCLFTVLLAIPTAIALSQCTGVFECGCPILAKVILMIIPSWKFWNSALSSVSAADATTNLMIVVLK